MGILEVNIIPHDEKNNEFDEVSIIKRNVN